jgi:hypothetical protein
MIARTVEIGRPPEDVFAYLDQFERHGEWQETIVDSRVETEGPATGRDARRADAANADGSPEGCIRADRARAAEEGSLAWSRRSDPSGGLGDGRARGRRLELAGHARARHQGPRLGKILVPLVRRQAAREVPKAQARLKERLESGAA